MARFGNVQLGNGHGGEMLDGFKTALGEQRFAEFQSQRMQALAQQR